MKVEIDESDLDTARTLLKKLGGLESAMGTSNTFVLALTDDTIRDNLMNTTNKDIYRMLLGMAALGLHLAVSVAIYDDDWDDRHNDWRTMMQ